jgi:hypothetical protein
MNTVSSEASVEPHVCYCRFCLLTGEQPQVHQSNNWATELAGRQVRQLGHRHTEKQLLNESFLTTVQISQPAIFDMDTAALARECAHTRDTRIVMNEEYHKYYVDFYHTGVFTRNQVVSASGFSGQFFPKFDADKIISTLKGPKWQGRSPEDIKAEWKAGADYGTYCHKLLEDFFNGKPLTTEDRKLVEIRQFLKFRAKCMQRQGLVPWRTEWKLYSCPSLLLVGTLDLLCVHKEQDEYPSHLKVHMFDHKFSKAIRMRGFRGETGSGPCQAVENCNYNKYSLAMLLYRYLLETYYHDVQWGGRTYKNIKVTGMGLDVFHKTHDDYQYFDVPTGPGSLENVFEHMLQDRRDTVKQFNAKST